MNNERVVLITGGSRGIGAAVAVRAAQAGYAVGITYRERGDEADRITAAIKAGGGRAVATQGDVSVEADVIRNYDEVTQALGPVYALVNNAGITGGTSAFADITLDRLEAVVRTNLIGAMICAREAVRRMATSRGGAGGVIVNISSGAARSGSPGTWLHYAVTKGAIDTFTIGLARETARDGIRVNAVRVGPTATDMITGADPARTELLRKGIPLGRFATPDEMATGILWMLDPQGTFVTGATLDVTGAQ